MSRVAISNLKGEQGADLITDTNVHTGVWESIQALEAVVINALITTNVFANDGTTLTHAAVPIPAGATIYGRFTSIDLTSGKILAYRSTENR